jgi:hypothetical protein
MGFHPRLLLILPSDESGWKCRYTTSLLHYAELRYYFVRASYSGSTARYIALAVEAIVGLLDLAEGNVLS